MAEETERKYILHQFHKTELWDREFVIFQWYDVENSERKLKIIFDLVNLYQRWVVVTKERLSNSHSNKKIEYLAPETIDLSTLVGKPFVMKRRSVLKDICIDEFIRSNGICQYMLENEGGSAPLEEVANEMGLFLTDVTDDVRYRNTNMTTTFSEQDLANLKLLIKIVRK